MRIKKLYNEYQSIKICLTLEGRSGREMPLRQKKALAD